MTAPDESFFTHLRDAEGTDPARYLLANKGSYERAEEIAVQLICRDKTRRKLPDELACPLFYFPSVLAAEQSTSDYLADFHASLLPSGDTVLDLTAGLGIDAMHIARRAAEVTAIERQQPLVEALTHNARVMGLENLTAICADSVEFLQTSDRRWNTIFIDPHRRGDAGERVFNLAHCSPDVTALLPLLREKCDRVIVKASPMLDITRTLIDLPGTSALYVTGSATECKELVAVVRTDSPPLPEEDVPVTIVTPGYDMTFTRAEEAAATASYGVPAPGQLLFEPGPATMKGAPFKLLSARFGLRKLAPNTHLYFADTASPGFPGTTWLIDEVLPYSSSVIKRFASRHPKAEVAVRNFDTPAETLRAKLRLKSGGPLRVIATTLADGAKILLVLSPSDQNKANG